MKKRILLFILLIFILLISLVSLFLYKSNEESTQISFSEEDKTEEIVNNNTSQPKKEESPLQPEEIQPEIDTLEENSEEETIEEPIQEEEEESEMDIEKEKVFSEKKETQIASIPYSKSLFHKIDENNQFISNKLSLNQDEKNFLKIDKIKTNIGSGNFSEDQFCKGKVYYSGGNGHLESVIVHLQDETIHEYLIFYNSEGNYKDCIEIGVLTPQKDKKKYTILSGNKLSVYEILSKSKERKTEETVTEYYISPQLELKKGKTFSKIF